MKICPLAATAATDVRFRLAVISLLALSTGGCSAYMEATRPDPVDLDKFKPGEARIDVIGQVGSPSSSVKDQDKNCDVYQLYTRGPGTWGKAGIAFGEAAADVFTLGLAEAVTTPAEAVTRNKLHTVLFCYAAGETLVAVREPDIEQPATAPTKQATGSMAQASAQSAAAPASPPTSVVPAAPAAK